jgi:hypothetical protein
MKKSEPVEKDEEGNITYNLHATAADVDWIRASRILKLIIKKNICAFRLNFLPHMKPLHHMTH